MLVSLNWLRDYIDLPADVDVDDLAHRLTMASAEVEGVRRVGGEWDRDLVRVGHVLKLEPHPDADRLRLATVDYGGEAPQRVVCGAPNVAEGQRIAFAREGAMLFDGHSGKAARLKRSTIRGIASAGMVLSERELGLSEAHEGILVLPADAPVGTPLLDYLGDVVLDVHVWPNRADTMNMVGIAREIAAILGIPTLREPDESYAEGGAPAAEAVAVQIEDPALCARYIATVIEGVTVAPSPAWMQERLRAAGMRPINNVVDITNYVMLELGQPLHAFDADSIRGDGARGSVGVRLARPGEALRTLDGVDRALSGDTLVIVDAGGPIALAGVMGGAATEVTAATTRVLLEAARFDPVSVRRTSFRLALRSEASARFERGLSPELAAHASRRATKLLVELCGGSARRGAVDAYPAPPAPVEVTLTRARLDTVIGLHVPTAEVEAILATLGFAMLASDDGSPTGAFRVRAPWWRTDVAIPDDIAEEVVRLAGYDRLPATAIRGAIPEWEPNPLLALREGLRDALAGAGMQEVITYSLTTPEVLARVLAPEALAALPPLRLRNTLSADRQVLRPTLRHAILETVEHSLRAGAGSVAIFEAARVFLPHHESRSGGVASAIPRPEREAASAAPPALDGADRLLPEEREQIVGAVAGVEIDRWGRPGARALDFSDAKGVLETAFAALHVVATYTAAEEYGFLPGRVAHLEVEGEAIGVVGEVHPQTLARFDIERPVVLFEIDLARLLARLPERVVAREVPRFPAVEQDLALVVDEGVAAGAMRAVIEASPLVAAATVFDVFRGGSVPAGKKSVAFAIRYQAPNRTLTGEDASKEQAKLLKRLEREFGAELRA